LSVSSFNGSLVSKLVEVDLVASDLAGFCVIVDLCDLPADRYSILLAGFAEVKRARLKTV
jgi:hypothetical protein